MRTARTLLDTGWRPGAGWVCVMIFLYAGLGYGLLNWALAMYAVTHQQPIPPLKEPSEVVLFEFIGLFLTLAGYRTYEKFKGVNNDNPSAQPDVKP